MSAPKHRCPNTPFAIGAAPQYCGPEPLLQAIYREPGCGCRVVGNGTLPHPLAISYCPKHAAAPEMAEALSRLVALVDETQSNSEGRYPAPDPGCLECTEGTTPAHLQTGPCAYHDARAALRKAGVL